MTKAENRAAAKAYAAERVADDRRRQLEQDIAADLEQLRIFRDYFLLQRKVWRIDCTTLISLIDDHAERLTGDRTALHSNMATWGGSADVSRSRSE